MFIIDDIILNKLANSSLEAVKDKFTRHPRFIKLLEKFNLKPNKPPQDFAGVYVYTLIEYGAGKPKAILELFNQKEIQAAFNQAFQQDNPQIFLQEVEDYLASCNLGDELISQEIDCQRELAEFTALFIEVVKRLRTPDDVRRDNILTNIERGLKEVREQLQQINSLAEIKSLLEQLTESSQQLSPSLEQESKLAKELRSWFTTLGYSFEPYKVITEDYFEWIINIPGRRRFERILVRGVDGEVGIHDLNQVREVVERNNTDEGWIVAPRRVSSAARDELKQEDNRVFCYTFDELLDETADFSGYFDWLEQEVKSRAIDRTYVPLGCKKEEVNPKTQERVGVSSYGEEQRGIDGYIDVWLDDPAKEHISILGEFGTGKTWFAFHYAWTALEKYLAAKKRGTQRPRLPLVIPLRDYAKAVTVESLFSEFFFRKHEMKLPGYSAFEQLNRMGKLLLIFDGFDEMAARVDRQAMVNNFWELAKVVVPGTKAILTCRTEHFPEAKEGRRLLNAQLQASTSNLTGQPPQFEVLELEKFTEEQIQQVLSFKTDEKTVEKVMGNEQLLDLARRPVTIELILEALPEIEAGKAIDISRIYLYAVRRKLERDIKAERTFTSMEDKLYFLCELSWEMLSTDRMSLNYKEFPSRIRGCFGAKVEGQKDLDHWHYDMMGQTMLVRNAEGDYYPAHRSLLEFFVAFKFAAELGILAADFREVITGDCVEGSDSHREAQAYTWSAYFQQKREGNVAESSPLLEFMAEDIAQLAKTVGFQPISLAILELLEDMIVDDLEEVKSRLLRIIKLTGGKDEVGYVGGNLATLLAYLNSGLLPDYDFSQANLIGFNASLIGWEVGFLDHYLNLDLSRSSFRESNLTNANLSDCKLTAVDFRSSNLDGIKFHPKKFYDMSFHPKEAQLVISSNKEIILWDLNTWSLKARVNSTNCPIVQYTPDGTQIVNSKEGGFEVRDAQTLQLISEHHNSFVEYHNSFVDLDDDGKNPNHSSPLCFTFEANSNRLFLGCRNSCIHVWDFVKKEEVAILQQHQADIVDITISPNNQYFFSSSGFDIIVWSLENLNLITEKSLKLRNSCNPVYYSNDELICVDNQSVCFVDLITLEIKESFSIRELRTPFRIAISLDKSLLYVVTWEEFCIIDLLQKQTIYHLEFEDIVPPLFIEKRNVGIPIGAEFIGFNQEYQNIVILLPTGAILVFDIKSKQVVNTIWPLPDVRDANFTNATGLTEELKYWLAAYGAIV